MSDSILTRNDELAAWHYDINSTDGDRVPVAKIELWYDSDNDKKVDTKIQEWNGLGNNEICEFEDFLKFTPTQLGYYKYIICAKDEFVDVIGQDTLKQYVTDTDKKEETYEVEFWVDNYQPLSDLYIDAAIERPNVDLYIMGDKELPQEDLTYLSENRVSIENFLLGRNILPDVNLWNMKTYLDHNITRADTDKGIVERKIMFRKDSGEWQYYIPDTLTYGSYEVKYYVKDMEGAWSDPWLYSFTLDDSPQFIAQARSKDSNFSLKSIPASEDIEAYNLWTRQPGDVKLEMNLTPEVDGLPSTRTVYFKETVTGKQNGQDIDWFNQTLKIPDIFPDGERTFIIRARDIKTGISTPKTFLVNVYTPINLQPNLIGRTINTNISAQITARTTKYPDKTIVIMQYGTKYQSGVISMNGTVKK